MNEYWEQSLRLLTLSDANVRYVLLGMLLLGVSGGVLGSLTVLRKRALIGDALAHAALPGIGIAFLLTGVKSLGVLISGAFVAGVIGVLVILVIVKYSRIKDDSALAIVLTVFFGLGIVILTYIQKSGKGAQSGLDKFLFGQSASLIESDVLIISVTSLILMVLVALFQKELKLLCFSPEYASTLGFGTIKLDLLLMGMIVLAVVIGLQAVGVVLMSALLIIPPVTARLWTDNFGKMLIISGVVGGISGLVGAYLSFLAPKMPSGPLTVLASSTVFLFSLFIAPNKGILSRIVNRIRMVRKTTLENGLRAVAELMETVRMPAENSYEMADIRKVRTWTDSELKRHLNMMKKNGFIAMSENSFSLTDIGINQAESLLKRHRLWELYLIHHADIAADHVHRDADDSEHYLTPEIENRLIKIVGAEAEKLISPHPISQEGN